MPSRYLHEIYIYKAPCLSPSLSESCLVDNGYKEDSILFGLALEAKQA
jgi:hypothetical protein